VDYSNLAPFVIWLVIGVVAYACGAKLGGRKQAEEAARRVTQIISVVLRTAAADYPGRIVGIEMPREDLVVLVQDDAREYRWKAVPRQQFNQSGEGMWEDWENITFELVDSKELTP
jgi:hypothetical protein